MSISSLLCSPQNQIESRTMARFREATPPGVHKPGPWGGDDSELDVFAAERYFNGDDALWCARSSSSFSSKFRTGTQSHEHDASVATVTAVTSSSEASWNSRSALLPDGKLLAAPSVVEVESRGTGSERPRGKPSSHLRRWLLGVAGCACIGGDSERSASANDLFRDELEDDNVVGVGGKKLADGAGQLFQRTESKVLAVAEAISARVRPGRSLDDGDEFLAGKVAFSPFQVQLAGDGHRRAVNPGEHSAPIVNPATTAALVHEQRRISADMLRPLVSTKQHSAFTIVAGKKAPGGGLLVAGGGGESAAATGRPSIGPCDTSEEDAAPSELGCAYPPSEASVVWSVVTADGAASCNFSSVASGHYYHFNGGEDGAVGRSNRRRRSGITNSGGLLTCMGDKAVNAVGLASVGRLVARSDSRNRPSAGYPVVMRHR